MTNRGKGTSRSAKPALPVDRTEAVIATLDADESGEAARRLAYQATLLSLTPEVAGYGPTVAMTVRKQTIAAFKSWIEQERRRNRTSSWILAALLMPVLFLALASFSWMTVGLPLRPIWLWAMVAPALGFLWVILLAGFFSAVTQGLRAGEWAWDEGLKNSKWAKGRQLSERCKISYRLLTGVGVGVVLVWSGNVLWQNWPGGGRGVLYGLGVIVAMLIAAEVFGLAVLLPYYALCPIDVRDTIVLSLSDCLSEARLGYVIRSGARTRIRAGTGLFRRYEAPQTWPQEGLPPVKPILDQDAGLLADDSPYSWQLPTPQEAAWRVDRAARRHLARELSRAARSLEPDAARIAPRDLAEVRASLRDYGRRVAAGFRVHARAVALGGPEQDDCVVAALAAGYVAACQSRWEDLGHAEPQPFHRRLGIVVLQRAGVVGAFIAAAFLVPPLLADGQVEGQVRGVLLAAAVLAVTAPRDAVTDVQSALRRFITGGRAL
jgi:hypothetical protein